MPRVIYLLVALSAIASQPALAAPVRVDFSGSVQTLSGEIIQSAGEPIPISEADAEAALGGSVQV